MFCFGFDLVVRLESLAMLGIGCCIRGLLRRFTGTGKGLLIVTSIDSTVQIVATRASKARFWKLDIAK
jgi:hypothetical protein